MCVFSAVDLSFKKHYLPDEMQAKLKVFPLPATSTLSLLSQPEKTYLDLARVEHEYRERIHWERKNGVGDLL